jgi:glycosyltransferase involved in cell wall biosynthesis
MQYLISVVICTYNRERHIAACIKSLLLQTINPKLFEVIIVNNVSTDNTEKIVLENIETWQKEINLKYCVEYNQGLSFARNKGVVESNGDFICFIDDDAIADKNYLKIISDFIQNKPDLGGLGGKIIPLFIDGKPEWMNKFMLGVVGYVNYSDQIIELTKKYPIGCNMVYKREILIEVGMFNVDLGRKGSSGEASEEKDIFFKVRNKGFKIYYLPDAKVQHIIESNRLTNEYIDKLAIGVGQSEYKRCRSLGLFAVIKKFINIFLKFIAALIISVFYICTFKYQKALALTRYGFNILKGYSLMLK